MFWSARISDDSPTYLAIPEGQELQLSHAAVVSGKKMIVLSMEVGDNAAVVLASLFPKSPGGTQCTFTINVPSADASTKVIFRVTSGAVDLCGNIEVAEGLVGAIDESDESSDDDSDCAGYEDVWEGFGADYFDDDSDDSEEDGVFGGQAFDLDDADESEEEKPPPPKRKLEGKPTPEPSSSGKKKRVRKRRKKSNGKAE